LGFSCSDVNLAGAGVIAIGGRTGDVQLGEAIALIRLLKDEHRLGRGIKQCVSEAGKGQPLRKGASGANNDARIPSSNIDQRKSAE
jgi:hypothetical protein